MERTTLGEYALLDLAGAGTAGDVYRARHTPTGEIVALKMLRNTGGVDPDIEQRFVREVSVLQKLEHENIVKYDYCGLEDGILFFTMEYIDSGSLKQLLGGPVPWQDVVDLAIQVCQAIQHAHESGVIHRDLKPANLYLSGDGQVKVGDFGLALDFGSDRLTAEGLTVGTCRYMAPEQITADEITPQADLYSLGCILFEMLSGRVPFDGDTGIEVVEQHLSSPPPALDDLGVVCPPALSDLIQRLLSKEPQNRPETADGVRQELTQLRNRVRDERSGDDRLPDQHDESSGSSADQDANLTERLRGHSTVTSREVSWVTLAAAFSILAVAIFAFWFFTQGS